MLSAQPSSNARQIKGAANQAAMEEHTNEPTPALRSKVKTYSEIRLQAELLVRAYKYAMCLCLKSERQHLHLILCMCGWEKCGCCCWLHCHHSCIWHASNLCMAAPAYRIANDVIARNRQSDKIIAWMSASNI